MTAPERAHLVAQLGPTTPSILLALSEIALEHQDWPLLRLVAANPAAPADMLQRIADTQPWHVTSHLAAATVDSDLQRRFAADPRTTIRSALASNTAVDADALMVLADQPYHPTVLGHLLVACRASRRLPIVTACLARWLPAGRPLPDGIDLADPSLHSALRHALDDDNVASIHPDVVIGHLTAGYVSRAGSPVATLSVPPASKLSDATTLQWLLSTLHGEDSPPHVMATVATVSRLRNALPDRIEEINDAIRRHLPAAYTAAAATRSYLRKSLLALADELGVDTVATQALRTATAGDCLLVFHSSPTWRQAALDRLSQLTSPDPTAGSDLRVDPDDLAEIYERVTDPVLRHRLLVNNAEAALTLPDLDDDVIEELTARCRRDGCVVVDRDGIVDLRTVTNKTALRRPAEVLAELDRQLAGSPLAARLFLCTNDTAEDTWEVPLGLAGAIA